MVEKRNARKWVFAGLLAGLLLISAIAGAMAAIPSLASAQSTGRARVEAEVDDQDDGQEGPDVPITGSALDKASAAALEYAGGGLVTGTEIGDEEGYYEVEITLPNGSQVDVHLDEAFNVLGQETE